MGFIIEGYLVKVEDGLTINYRDHESGYHNAFYEKNIPWNFEIMKSLDKLGANFEVNIIQRVLKLRLIWENGCIQGF